MKKISRRAFMFLGAITLAVPGWLAWLWGQLTKPVRALLPTKPAEDVEWVPVEHIATRTLDDGTVTRMKEHYSMGVVQKPGLPFEGIIFKGAERYEGKDGFVRRWVCAGCKAQFGYHIYSEIEPCPVCGGTEYGQVWIYPCAEDKISSEERRQRLLAEMTKFQKERGGISQPFTEQEKEFLVENLFLCKRYDEQKRRGSVLTPLNEDEQEAMRAEIRKSFES